jgi:acyl-CoA thioesterase
VTTPAEPTQGAHDSAVTSEPDASEFGTGIRVTPADEPGCYDAELGRGWQIGAGINGGMLLATAGSALRAAFADDAHPDPVAISAYYLSASRPGPAQLRTQVLRRGRSMSTGEVSLVQLEDGAPVERVRALATYGDLGSLPDDVRTTARPPVMPPPEECIASDAAPPDFVEQATLLERLDLRLDPACVGWAMGQPSGRGLLQGWLRLADGREPDALMLLLAVDALPPVTFDLGMLGWTPTLELSVHLRARPAPGWLAVTHRTRNFAGGLLEEDAEVWDSAGRLVAQSRQLARAPR